jgi:hypothetical protein
MRIENRHIIFMVLVSLIYYWMVVDNRDREIHALNRGYIHGFRDAIVCTSAYPETYQQAADINYCFQEGFKYNQ